MEERRRIGMRKRGGVALKSEQGFRRENDAQRPIAPPNTPRSEGKQWVSTKVALLTGETKYIKLGTQNV